MRQGRAVVDDGGWFLGSGETWNERMRTGPGSAR
jgi:hypothetical protein